jgi:signal transduction histidine kinase
VHDHLGQNLAISKLKIESLAQSATSPQLIEELKEIRDLIAQAVENARSLTFELSPPILYELGFGPAVEWLLRQTRQQHGLSTEFTDDELPKPLDDDIRVLLFQAVRELLVNVVKHAKASSVKVFTRKVDDQIQVSVEDDGVGFDLARFYSHDRMGGGFGLFNIRERLDHIGGHLGITSRTGKGTCVTLLAPITHKKKKARRKENEHKDFVG